MFASFGRSLAGLIDHGGGEGRLESTAERVHVHRRRVASPLRLKRRPDGQAEVGRFYLVSRADRTRVGPVVELLRAAGLITFRDEDSIQPGRPWRDVLDQSIASANTVFVLVAELCGSKAVQRGIPPGDQVRKNVVPVLLDDARLPPSLRRLQWVDFRHLMMQGTRRTVEALASNISAGSGLEMPPLFPKHVYTGSWENFWDNRRFYESPTDVLRNRACGDPEIIRSKIQQAPAE